MTLPGRRGNGAEDPDGFLSAVASASGRPGPVWLPGRKFLLVTSLAHTKQVLTDTETFTVPFNVSRKALAPDGSRDSQAIRGHRLLDPHDVAAAVRVFGDELTDCGHATVADHRQPAVVDTLAFLRSPVARSTTAALLPQASVEQQQAAADLTLAWVDALAPVISARRPPQWWHPIRRREQAAHAALVATLDRLPAVDDSAARAAHLAAGVQVPIAAGAWLLTQLAAHPQIQEDLRDDEGLAMPVVWETLRLYPPTWRLTRITVRDTRIGDTRVPAFTPVTASPRALGQRPELVPGPSAGAAALTEFDPRRWLRDDVRPGAWLPFGAGPHACPGRNLGLAQLRTLALWARRHHLSVDAPVRIDASRGLRPSPSTVTLRTLDP